MPAQFDIRPYTASDEEGLLETWHDAMWADPIDAVTWRDRYLLDPDFRPETTPVAVDPATGRVVGFVLGFTRAGSPDAWVVAFGVAPDHRREGIGTALMEAFETAARDAGATRILFGPYIPSYLTPGVDVSAYADALPFLASLGADEGGRPLSMKANLTNYRAEATVADRERSLAGEGITVRRATARDILPLLAFLDAHFPHWTEDTRGVMRDLFGGDPRGVTLHLAEDRGEIIGYAQTRAERFARSGSTRHTGVAASGRSCSPERSARCGRRGSTARGSCGPATAPRSSTANTASRRFAASRW